MMRLRLVNICAILCAALCGAGLQAQQSDYTAMLENEFPELKSPKDATSSKYIVDPKIQRTTATDEIKPAYAGARDRSRLAQAEASIKDAQIQTNRDALKQREKEVNDWKTLIKEWQDRIDAMPNDYRFMPPSEGQTKLNEAKAELKQALVERQKSAEIEVDKYDKVSTSGHRGRQREEGGGGRSVEATALAEREEWLVDFRKSNPTAVGALIERNTILVRFRKGPSIAAIKEVRDRNHLRSAPVSPRLACS